MLQWKEVIHFTTKGNPTPDKRVEKTESEWKAQLNPEQYRITRQKEQKDRILEHSAVFLKQENTIVFVAIPLFLTLA